jgi:hypothetical protein
MIAISHVKGMRWMDNAREAAICFNHDTVLRRKFQDALP